VPGETVGQCTDSGHPGGQTRRKPGKKGASSLEKNSKRGGRESSTDGVGLFLTEI